MNAVLLEGIVGMLLAALAGAFALAFASPPDTHRSIAHLRERRGTFRIGAFAVGAGLVFIVQADAVGRIVGLAAEDPGFLTTRAAGWILVMVGVAVIDAVLWMPDPRRAASAHA